MTETSRWRRRPGARGLTRRLTIGQETWRVFEFLCPFDLPGEVSLIFVTDDSWRRIRNFPANWATTDDSELFALTSAPR